MQCTACVFVCLWFIDITLVAATKVRVDKPENSCVKCYPYGVGGFCGGWLSPQGVITMREQYSPDEAFVVVPNSPAIAKNVHLIDAHQKNINKCLLHCEAWDQMQNVTPQYVDVQKPNFPANHNRSLEVDSVFVVKSNHGNRGLFHAVFGLFGFVAWARLNNIVLPVKNTLVLLHPSDTPDWLQHLKGALSEKVDTKMKEISVGVHLASALTVENGASMIRPLGGKYEKFWTDIAKIPPWNDLAPIQFGNLYQGRSGVFSPPDFDLFRSLILAKFGITEKMCKALPQIILMNRAAQHGISGRSILNIEELKQRVVKVFPDAHMLLVSDFDNLAIKTQIKFAACARLMIGPHGGGLTWSVLMPTGSRLVEIFPFGAQQCSKSYQSRLPMGIGITDFHRFALGADHHFDCVRSLLVATQNEDIHQPWRTRNIRIDPSEIEFILRLNKSQSDRRIQNMLK